MTKRRNASKKSIALWGWVALELAVTGWIGWQIAKAKAKPWARPPKGVIQVPPEEGG